MKDLHEDNLFGPLRERLGRYEETPSEELWSKIVSKKRERLWTYFLEPVGVVVVGMFLLFGGGDEARMAGDKVVDSKVVDGRIAESKIVDDKREVYNEKHSTNKIDVTDQAGAFPVITAEENSDSTTGGATSTATTINAIAPASANTTDTASAGTDTAAATTITVAKPTEVSKKDSSSIVREVVPPYKKPKSRFQFFLSVAPSLSFQKMAPTPNDALIVEGFAPRSSLSLKRFGFGIDAGFQRDINRFLGFYGGLSFYRQHQEIAYNYYNTQADVSRVDDSWTFDITRTRQTGSFEYNMTNVGVRSGLLVTVKGEKLKHKFGAGLLYSQGFAKSVGPYNNGRSSYLAYQLSYRNELWINDHLSWFIEPVFTYSFLSKEKLDEPFKLKPYRAGISMGVLYRF